MKPGPSESVIRLSSMNLGHGSNQRRHVIKSYCSGNLLSKSIGDCAINNHRYDDISTQK